MRLFGCPRHDRHPARDSLARSIEQREQDEIYRCHWKCSWIYSVKLGLLLPHGLDPGEIGESLAELYHLKQYRPARWRRKYRRFLTGTGGDE